ncbi:MAG: metallophosphoesterase family protein [Xanthobacteraceae bacterium]|nr:metallophosphoesterase family protein [Xanthobacteraceae bacterium]MBV9237131.1 metallophosphoesterase family protein [Xanthobacteraceae bacterium]MBV9631847.1 metallophosphoesterase family protein [Xanthobacteraceae bacterium]
MPGDILVGVISDTHGLLRPEAVDALRGVELILHAGDVGKPEVLDQLRQLAPLFVVRGNVDHGDWASPLPVSEIVEIGGRSFYMLHDIGELDLDPPTAGFAAVVFGHSHQPSIETREGVLFLNPGSAGPRRFKLPVSVARIRVSGGALYPQIITLNV